jgi:hypothetical protein
MVGTVSGTCQWLFTTSGLVQFAVSASGEGDRKCSAISDVALVGYEATQTPTPTPTPTVTPTPESPGPPPDGYDCVAHVQDEYGIPLAEKTVYLAAYSRPEGGDVVDSESGVTNEAGDTLLEIRPTSEVRRVECHVDPDEFETQVRGSTAQIVGPPVGSGPPLSLGMRVTLNPVAVPIPTHERHHWGMSWRSSALAALYVGADETYDRVVIIPEMFYNDEQTKGPRGRDGLWNETRRLALRFYELGYDVWLVSTITGQNIHEQAAEFAESIQYAAVTYPQTYGAADNYTGRAAIVGASLGGIVSRIATARWQADSGFRSQLGLQEELPVSLIFNIDSPLRGAQVGYELQEFIHDPFPPFPIHKDYVFNANSCAFQQIVRRTPLTVEGMGAGWEAFFETGDDFHFRSRGTCDFSTPDSCWCASGPAVLSLNGDGFAHAPYLRTVAYSDGTRHDPNTCYGDVRDRSRDGKDMCPSAPTVPYVPPVNSVGIEAIGDNIAPNHDIHYLFDDLGPGSRQGAVLEGRTDCGPVFCYTYKQYASGTFIPTVSAFGANDAEGCGVDDCRPNTFNGTHVNPPQWARTWLEEELVAALGPGSGAPTGWNPAEAPAPAPSSNAAPVVDLGEPRTAGVGDPVSLAAATSDADGQVVRTFWNLGDGTFSEGASVEHAYGDPGTYTVIFSAVDDHGTATTVETAVSVETPGIVTLISPPDGAEMHSPLLLWAPDAGATSYEVVVLDTSGTNFFNDILVAAEACNSDACGLALPQGIPGTTYRWYVIGVNAFGAGPVAAPRTVTVVSPD